MSATPGSDLYWKETMQPYEQGLRERAYPLSVGQEFRLCPNKFVFGETIDPTRGIGLRSIGRIAPGLYRVWRLDHGGRRVMLLALPARTGLTGPELYDERFVSVDVGEMRRFRAKRLEGKT